MKIWYDTEFLERGPEFPISLISIGMVREDGEELYLINGEMPISTVVRDPWLQMNVLPSLPIRYPNPGIIEWDEEHPDYTKHVWSRDNIARQVREFCEGDDTELWAYYGAHSHVALSQLFGTRVDYAGARMPQFTFDIMQLWASLGYPQGVLPCEPDTKHAFHDAVWARDAHLAIEKWRAEHDGRPDDVGRL